MIEDLDGIICLITGPNSASVTVLDTSVGVAASTTWTLNSATCFDSAAGISARNCVARTSVVLSDWPETTMTDVSLKLFPFTLSSNGGCGPGTWLGTKSLICGLWTVVTV